MCLPDLFHCVLVWRKKVRKQENSGEIRDSEAESSRHAEHDNGDKLAAKKEVNSRAKLQKPLFF